MALTGVVADIHGNREALVAALARLAGRHVERIVCLGDVVGFNADPDECVQMVRSRCAATIAGNHDLISLRRLGFQRCSNKAEYSLRRTRKLISGESLDWLKTLPGTLRLSQELVMVHGGVRDVQQYMVTPALIRDNAAFLEKDFPGARVCFFGHSHEQKVYEIVDGAAQEIPAHGKVYLRKENPHFINPGSVDASRKRGRKLAECAVFDSRDWSIEFLSIPYDSAATEAKAAVFGYRIPPLTDRYYTLRRRIRGRSPN